MVITPIKAQTKIKLKHMEEKKQKNGKICRNWTKKLIKKVRNWTIKLILKRQEKVKNFNNREGYGQKSNKKG